MDNEEEIKKIINKLSNYERNQWVKAGASRNIGTIKSFIGIREVRKKQGYFKS